MRGSKLTFARAGKMILPKAGHRLLFAYDDLMDAETVAERIPNPKFVCAARIESRRLIVNSDGLASITPRKDFEVHGVIWEVEEVAMTSLDLQLGVPSGVDRFGAFARDPAGTLVVSEFYAYRNLELGAAHPDYLAVILRAARAHRFPSAYLEQLARWDIDCQAA